MGTKSWPTIAPIGLVVMGVILSGCSIPAEPLGKETRQSTDSVSAKTASANLDSLSSGLAAIVAVADAEAFGSSSDSASGETQLASSIEDEEPLEDALSPAVETVLSEHARLMNDTAQALTAANVSVERTEVTPVDVETTSGLSGQSEVTVDMRFDRTLGGGEVWTEVIPYVATTETSTGEVLGLVIQDDTWISEQQAALEPQIEGIDNGPASSTERPSEALNPSDSSPDADTSTFATTGDSGIKLAGVEGTEGTEATEDAETVEGSSTPIYAAGRSKAASYASTYALKRNSNYIASPNDCTNFISQALYAGGWKQIGGTGNVMTTSHVWWYTGNKTWPKSNSWADAQVFYIFGMEFQRMGRWGSVYSMRMGDVLQYDTGTKGMNHTMMMTGKNGLEPLLSYHTTDTRNKPFTAIEAAVSGETYYAHGIK
jgi:hypothetical protein